MPTLPSFDPPADARKTRRNERWNFGWDLCSSREIPPRLCRNDHIDHHIIYTGVAAAPQLYIHIHTFVFWCFLWPFLLLLLPFFLCVCTCHSNCNYTVSKLLCFFDAQWNNIKRCCIWYSIKMFTCFCVCVLYVLYMSPRPFRVNFHISASSFL